MDRLTRYTFLQLLISTLLITAALAVVVWLAQSLRFIELIVNKGISIGVFIYLVALLLPNFLVVIIPFALLASVLFVYNRMVQDRELVVMRSAGLSQVDLMRPALLLAGLAMACLYGLYFYIAPAAKAAFKDTRWEITHGYSGIVLREGTFNSISRDVTVYVREQAASGEILGILARDARNPKKPFTLMAERGALIRIGNDTRIVMYNGNRQEVDRISGALSILYFDKHTLDLGATGGNTEGARPREADELSIGELLNVEQVAGINPKDFNQYRVSGHSRIITPIYALTFTLIGLAALLSGGFARRTMTRRIVAAVVIVVLVKLLSLGAEKFIIRHTTLIPLLYVTAVAMALAPLYLIFKRPAMPQPHAAGAEA